MERNFRLDWPALVKEAITRRKQQRLTQEQLAIILGISKPTLNRFEQGYTTVSLENALKILHALGLANAPIPQVDDSPQ